MDGLPSYYCVIVEDCIERNMTKEETLRHVENEYVIPLQDTNRASPPEVTSARRRKPHGTKPENRRSPPPACRTLLPDLNVPVASPQEAAAYAKDLENQNVQATQQQPAYPDDFWQRVMNTLGQIQSNTEHLDTLGHIQSNTEQVVKLLTDAHGFGPHPSAAGSLKRQRVEEAEERGDNEEGEKQQKNEEGNGEELQEKEEGNDEELQKNEGCDNV
ncbi:hypothetical protein HA466_0206150 [Hirschfeldia incana]|nr:hypothetical protein HA466_0206150 [Hirschfeldia incana]